MRERFVRVDFSIKFHVFNSPEYSESTASIILIALFSLFYGENPWPCEQVTAWVDNSPLFFGSYAPEVNIEPRAACSNSMTEVTRGSHRR